MSMCIGLTACGQKGPLFLPTPQSTKAPKHPQQAVPDANVVPEDDDVQTN